MPKELAKRSATTFSAWYVARWLNLLYVSRQANYERLQ